MGENRTDENDGGIMIFVFGSNLAGRHGKGAALTAKKEYGAIYGVGRGRSGNAYAIPTKDEMIATLPLDRIGQYVQEFLVYAMQHPDLTFLVTRIGCGLAGYTDEQIAPMFRGAPSNCIFDQRWNPYIIPPVTAMEATLVSTQG